MQEQVKRAGRFSMTLEEIRVLALTLTADDGEAVPRDEDS